MPKFQSLAAIVASGAFVTALAFAIPPQDGNPPQTPDPSKRPAAPATKADPADPILDDAIAKIRALKSVAAKVSMRGEMLNQSFDIRGEYLRAQDNRQRLDLALVGPAGAGGRMLQICDGAILWEVQQALDTNFYSKTDVSKILAKLNAPGVTDEQREDLLTRLGFAGPEALLQGLRKSIAFDSIDEAELDGRPVWILRGNWKDRESLTGPEQTPLPEIGPLPAYIPSYAVLTLGKDDGWPYKLEMEGRRRSIVELRGTTTKTDLAGKTTRVKAARTDVEPSRLTLVYSDVRLNPDLKPEDFAYQPPRNVEVQDLTDLQAANLENYLKMLSQEAQRKADEELGETAGKTTLEIPPATGGNRPPE